MTLYCTECGLEIHTGFALKLDQLSPKSKELYESWQSAIRTKGHRKSCVHFEKSVPRVNSETSWNVLLICGERGALCKQRGHRTFAVADVFGIELRPFDCQEVQLGLCRCRPRQQRFAAAWRTVEQDA